MEEQYHMFITEEEHDKKVANAFSWGLCVGIIAGAFAMFIAGVLIGAYL